MTVTAISVVVLCVLGGWASLGSLTAGATLLLALVPTGLYLHASADLIGAVAVLAGAWLSMLVAWWGALGLLWLVLHRRS